MVEAAIEAYFELYNMYGKFGIFVKYIKHVISLANKVRKNDIAYK